MTTKTIHNVETNELAEVELTAEELAQFEADNAALELEIVAIAAKEALKASRRAKLLALGLTEEELDA